MFKKMKLGTKLMAAFLGVGLLPFAVIGVLSLLESSDALSELAYGQLEAVREIKKGQIERFFTEREGDMGVLMETVANLQNDAFEKLGAVQQIKAAQIEGYFAERLGDSRVLSANEIVTAALTDFKRAFDADGGRIGGST